MPVVEIKLFPGRSAEVKADLGRAITVAMTEIAGIPAEATTIIFSEVARDNWIIAGKSQDPSV